MTKADAKARFEADCRLIAFEIDPLRLYNIMTYIYNNNNIMIITSLYTNIAASFKSSYNGRALADLTI